MSLSNYIAAAACPPLEYTTLVYTLSATAPIEFSDFIVIVKSLHGFKVDKIVPEAETRSITVGLLFFANMANARRKLGDLSDFISVERMSDQLQTEDLSNLQRLRSLYKFGTADTEEEPTTSKPTKRRKYQVRN